MQEPAIPQRIATLDLIRGIAVLGILTVNIAGFAGTSTSTLSPHLPQTGSPADQWTFAAIFVVFEGKMRALFTLLFGASMILFIDKVSARGRDGAMVQARRLGWLVLFGYLHFALLWWGDILFIYGLLGLVALGFHRMEPRRMAAGAVAFYALWHLLGMAGTWSELSLDAAVSSGHASAEEFARQAQGVVGHIREAAKDHATFILPYFKQTALRLSEDWLQPLLTASVALGETVPLMLIGMALMRSGFFAGEWPNRSLRRIAVWGIGSGLALTLALLIPAWNRGFPPATMFAYMLYWTAIPHLLMALGYTALLMLLAPGLIRSWLGQRLQAAGRMAFSNYIATSLVMCAIFYGWGLGLIGRYGHAQQIGFVLFGWVLMLAWSKPWLARFRQGPLEWLWRSLTEGRAMAFRR